MKTYKPGDVATALGVSISSIRNWTEQAEFDEFFSDMAKRIGPYADAKQREYTQQDLYVLNTISRQKTRYNSWDDVAEYLRAGHLDTELPPSASLVTPMTSAEGFADAIMLRQRVEMLQNALNEAEEEIDYLRQRVDEVRDEEQAKARNREEKLHDQIIELNKQIAVLEYKLNKEKDDEE